MKICLKSKAIISVILYCNAQNWTIDIGAPISNYNKNLNRHGMGILALWDMYICVIEYLKRSMQNDLELN